MAPKAIPDRWLAYKACGGIIQGTRIICFKVPLRKAVQEKEPTLTEIWDIPSLLSRIPKLSAVIDLTNTDRYYDPRDLLKANILHKKILMPGRVIPPEGKVIEFMDTVDEFLGVDCVAVQERRARRGLSTADSLIGVHCTHGLNRTGYMVCRYMRDRLGIPGPEALNRFETARGYKVERPVYINDIIKTEKVQEKGKPPRAKQNISRNKPSEMIGVNQSEQSSGFSNSDQVFHKQEYPFNSYVSHNDRSYFQRNSDIRFANTSRHSDRESGPSNNFRGHNNFRGNYTGRNNFKGPPNYSGPKDRLGPNSGPRNYSGPFNRSFPVNYNEPNKFSGFNNFRGTNQRNHNDRYNSAGTRYRSNESSKQVGRNSENNWNAVHNRSSQYSRTWRNSNYGDRRPRNNTDHCGFDETIN